MDQGGSQVQAPLHPSGIRAYLALDGLPDIHQVHQFADAPVRLLAAQSVQKTLQPEKFPSCLLVVQGRVLESDTDATPHEVRLSHHIVACDRYETTGRRQERYQHANDGGLPGPVGTQKPINLAPANCEVHSIHRPE